jgi:hypothetical protein
VEIHDAVEHFATLEVRYEPFQDAGGHLVMSQGGIIKSWSVKEYISGPLGDKPCLVHEGCFFGAVVSRQPRCKVTLANLPD